MPVAVLSNYLWVPKSAVKGTPSEFAPEFEYRIPLLNTPEGRQIQQQIAAINEMSGDDLLRGLSSKDELIIKKWNESSRHWYFCRGDLKKIYRLAKRLGLQIKDKRVKVPWPNGISQRLKMVLPPRDYQIAPFHEWEKAGHGIFEADPGFGKTYILCWRIINLKQMTLVLVHTDTLVEQFIERFRYGSGTKETGYSPVTNCLEVEEYLGSPIIGRYKSPDRLYPVTVATWQSFSSDSGRKALQKIKKEFGLVMPDEAHVFAAPVPASVVNSFYAYYRHGVTATPERKDQLDVALYDTVGPVTAKGVMKQLPITATLISTGVRYTPSRFNRRSEWSRMLNFLVKQSSRNDLIFRWIQHDIEQGRHLLLLSDRRQWVLDMVERLNRADISARAVLGGMGSKRGIEERNKIIGMMMAGEVEVIAATQVFKAGVDIPILDTVYVTCPMSNKPQLKQIAGRIRRAYEGKQEPVLRYFVDEGAGQLYGCARGTHKHLVELGANIILVPTGRRPDQVTFGDGYRSAAAEGSLRRRKTNLKTAAARSPHGVEKLFEDIRTEARETERYKRRIGGKS